MHQTAETVEEWISLAEAAERMAALALGDEKTVNMAWTHAGFACECLLKAAIMKKERFNSWPSRAARRDLYTHDLSALAEILGLTIDVMHPVAPAWAVVVGWRRDHTYVARQMPVPVVESLLDAVFSERGVGTWIRRNYLMS